MFCPCRRWGLVPQGRVRLDPHDRTPNPRARRLASDIHLPTLQQQHTVADNCLDWSRQVWRQRAAMPSCSFPGERTRRRRNPLPAHLTAPIHRLLLLKGWGMEVRNQSLCPWVWGEVAGIFVPLGVGSVCPPIVVYCCGGRLGGISPPSKHTPQQHTTTGGPVQANERVCFDPWKQP
jgi:hypothetical protein